MTKDCPLLVQREGAMVTLTLNRPQNGNALNQEMGEALLDQAIRCDNDETIRCVVLTGNGRIFCSGGDIEDFRRAGGTMADMVSRGASTLHLAMSKFARMNKPLVALVNGPAGGAGLSIALAGDIVVAATSAHFSVGYSAIGMTPDGGLTWLLPKLIGLRRAQDMILANRRIDAREAVEIGLVTRVVEDEALEAEGRKIATELADAATDAIGAARSLILQGFGNGIEAQMEIEARAITRASIGDEAREGFAAFASRRKPLFASAASEGRS